MTPRRAVDAELGNVLWKRVQRNELGAAEATSLAALIGAIPATRHTHSDLLEGAVGLALDLSITVHDALYVALAQALDAPLVTADGWLVERARTVVNLTLPRLVDAPLAAREIMPHLPCPQS